jgi:hypothetical protein
MALNYRVARLGRVENVTDFDYDALDRQLTNDEEAAMFSQDSKVRNSRTVLRSCLCQFWGNRLTFLFVLHESRHHQH